MEIQGLKIAQKCYITTICTRRALLHHHHVETVPWGGKSATALCFPSVNQRRSMPGREENRTIGGKKGKNCHTNASEFQKRKTCRGEIE